jgi:hypothetical protein
MITNLRAALSISMAMDWPPHDMVHIYIYKLLKVLFLRDIKFHVLVFKHASRGVVFLHCPIFNEKLIEGDTLVFVHHYHG